MNNYQEYKKLIELLKSLRYENIILAHEMSKGLGLEKQIIHDIDCILNSYNVADALIDKFVISEKERRISSNKNMQKFKNIDVNFSKMTMHFFQNGYVLDIRVYKSVCYNNPKHLSRARKRIIKLAS